MLTNKLTNPPGLEEGEGFAGELLVDHCDFMRKASLQTLEDVHKHLVHHVKHLGK